MSFNHYLEEQLKIAADQRKRCQEQYPDWKNDEFNCADNKFIWGISSNPAQQASFCTLNLIQIYFNRKTKVYYLDLDLDSISEPELETTLKNLWNEFATIVDYNHQSCSKKLSLSEMGMDLFSAESLEDLYFKFKVLTSGYLAAVQGNVITGDVGQKKDHQSSPRTGSSSLHSED